jgi:hypothetical protein
VFLLLIFEKHKVLLAEPATPTSITNNVSVMLEVGVARIPLVDSILTSRDISHSDFLVKTREIIKTFTLKSWETYTFKNFTKNPWETCTYIAWGFINSTST